MAFTSPLFLLALLPWAAVALYLLWGRRKRQNVPFLELWRGPAAVERARWNVSAPPIALAMAVAGLLAAVLGAARPGARWGGGTPGTAVTPVTPAAARKAGAADPRITLLLDRGVTMSARGRSDLRFREAGRAAADEVARVFGPGAAVDAWTVPGIPGAAGPSRTPAPSDDRQAAQQPTRAAATDPASWAASLSGVLPTALDAREPLRQLLRQVLAQTAGPVVVVSDADLGDFSHETGPLGADARRVVRVAPETPVRNVGITRLAARAAPRPQVMVRVRNDSPLASAVLSVSASAPGANAGAAVERRAIDLPPAGAERDYFFDPKELGAEVSAELAVDDDLPADNRAWLVRESTWPIVELARPVGPLQRLVEVYRALHPPTDGSRRVRVVDRPEDLAAGESGVILAAAAPGEGDMVRPTRVEPHPITQAVRDWPALDLPVAAGAAAGGLAHGGAQPPSGWAVVLSAGERPLVAVHAADEGGPAGPSRQVWVALDTARWADRPEYVAFWTAVLDWAGGADPAGGEAYASYPLEQFDSSWRPVRDNKNPWESLEPGLWPGVYERLNRAPTAPGPPRSLRAFNVSPVPLPPPAAGQDPSWRQKLRSLRAAGPGWHDLTPVPLLAAAALVLLATATWRKGR